MGKIKTDEHGIIQLKPPTRKTSSVVRPGNRPLVIKDAVDNVVDGKPPPKSTRKDLPKKGAVKLCVKCQTSQPLDSFYKNNGWTAQAYHDAWCRSCVRKYSTAKETLREYCFYNNRAWSEMLWDRSKEAARYKLATDMRYNRANDKNKSMMEDPIACTLYISQMNMLQVYKYSENMSVESGLYPAFDSSKSDEAINEDNKDEMRIDTEVVYDPAWNGLFAKRELEYLNNYYHQLETDFALDDVSMRDYARKVAKASLTYDDVYNKHKKGEATSKELGEAKSNFDELSKSANFAACRRRVDDKTMVLPLGQIVEYLEANNKIYARKETWDKDSVDQMIIEMYHIATSLGLDSGAVSSDD